MPIIIGNICWLKGWLDVEQVRVASTKISLLGDFPALKHSSASQIDLEKVNKCAVC